MILICQFIFVFTYYRSPGFGLTLVAETTKGAYLSAEAISNPKGSDKGPSTAEDVGMKAAYLLLEEIYRVRRFQLKETFCFDHKKKDLVCFSLLYNDNMNEKKNLKMKENMS